MPAQRPRLTTPGPLLQGNGELHIVGVHEVLTVADPLGAMQRLLRLANGSRSPDEIYRALETDFPQLDERDFDAALRELESRGVLEDDAPRAGRILPGPVSRRDAHTRSLFGTARVIQ